MALRIDLQNDALLAIIPSQRQFASWVILSLQQEFADIEQTIRIVDESESRALNHRYRQIDKPTNVLAFPADPDHLDYACLGDLIICAPLVEREAEAQGKEPLAHWAHLVVHGMLHLQGFDHDDEGAAARMEAQEIKILDTLGYTNPYND